MNPKKAFAWVAASSIEGTPKHERAGIFTALAVVAEEMHLAQEHAVALETVDAIQASDAKQMSFEALIQQELTKGGGK